MGLEAASELGTRHDSLKALRKIIARAIDECESKRDLSSLSARFTDVCAQIEDIESRMETEVSSVDDFEAQVYAINGGKS